ALGTITFALAALPGSPQVHNAIPTSYFGTNVYAAPYFGLGSAAVMLIAGIAWLEYRMKQIRKTGEEFMPIDSSGNFISTLAGLGESSDVAHEKLIAYTAVETDPSVTIQGLLCLIPIRVVNIVMFSFVF